MFKCPDCDSQFTRKDNLQRHRKKSCVYRPQMSGLQHAAQSPAAKRLCTSPSPQPDSKLCDACGIYVQRAAFVGHLRSLRHKQNCCSPSLEQGVIQLASAFQNRIASYRISKPEVHHISYQEFFQEVRDKCFRLIFDYLEKENSIKINMEVFGRYLHQTQELIDIKSFNTINKIVTVATDLDALLNEFFEILLAKTSEFQEYNSGWTLEKVLFLELNFNKFNPLKASSYLPLPSVIEVKKAVVNIRNDDQACFAWAVLSAKYAVQNNVNRISSYPHYSTKFDLTGITFPVKLKDIPKFEILNNISINVYGLEWIKKDNKPVCEVVGPLYYSSFKGATHVNLLLISNDQGNNHYCWIKDMSRLVSSQLSKHQHKKFLCDGCLQYFTNEVTLSRHQQYDCNHVYTTLPTGQLKLDKIGRLIPDNILLFQNFQKQIKVPFVIYADFESILKPIQTCQPDPTKKFSNITYKHIPYSYSYFIKCSFNDSLSRFRIYRGKDSAKHFTNSLDVDVFEIYSRYLKHVVPMLPLTCEEEQRFRNDVKCNICHRDFLDDDVRVRDHCHLTGKVRIGAAHSNCNLNYKLPNFIPIFFHNLSGYDAHLFLKEMAETDVKFTVIAQNKEKYISFSKLLYVDDVTDRNGIKQKVFIKLRFLDSFRFMASSLDRLSTDLDTAQCIQTKKFFPIDRQFQLMRKKGVFPYSYIDDYSKLSTTSLPTKDDFFDKLTNTPINDEDYNRAVTVWNEFKCSTMGEYSDLYLKTDVLLLTDVFENFRNICIDTYSLDPAQYYTAPGLAWDAMLKMTDISLELLTDTDMFHFFKKGVRGGISQCIERHHLANNPYVSDFNPDIPTSYIMYLDATNLYGYAMSRPLPTSGFRWLNDYEIDHFDLNRYDSDSIYGFVLEVDVEYPQYLHDLHTDLPFLVENIASPIARNDKIKKLIPTLYPKNRYIVHYLNLKQALKHGLKLIRIHRIIEFNQSNWLKRFIDFNTQLRNQTTSKFGKNFYKLMNNSVFGKTMENIDKRVDIKLVTHWQNSGRFLGAESLIAKPNFKSSKIFTPNFVAVQMNKVKVIYDKPIYVGFSILDLSKIVMYDFFYDFLKPKYGNDISLLYMDTDSFILKVFTTNFYDDIHQNLERFDTSNYKANNRFGIPITESVVGKFKDEFPDQPIRSFFGTGAKAYCVETENSVMKKAKGIKKSVIENSLTIRHYGHVIFNDATILKTMNIFVSDHHTMFTTMKNKVALTPKDDKRYLIPNTYRSLPWGHYDISFLNNSPIPKALDKRLEIITNTFEEYHFNNKTVGELFLERIFMMSNISNEILNNIYDEIQLLP